MVAKVFVVFAFLASVVYTLQVIEDRPFDCPPNEQYYKCNLEVCWKTCDHLLSPPPCPSISSDCYQPSCECIANYLRDGEGKCVPSDDCPQPALTAPITNL